MDATSKESIRSTVSKCVELLWGDDQLIDLEVKVEDDVYRCHRVILGACSKFFRSLISSNMKESKESCVTLHGVSSNIFQLILICLYKGENVITHENYIEIWHVADLLQIEFLLTLCERFMIQNLSFETCGVIYRHAKMLSSTSMISKSFEFMLNNFTQIGTKAIFDLGYEELLELVTSPELKVDNEDIVLLTVIKWFEHFLDDDPCYCLPCGETLTEETKELKQTFITDVATSGIISNEIKEAESGCSSGNSCSNSEKTGSSLESAKRVVNSNEIKTDNIAFNGSNLELISSEKSQEFFIIILKAVRLFLVSHQVLKNIYCHRLLADNLEAKEIIFHAMSLQITDPKDGQWPSSAIYRSSSEFDNVGIFAKSDGKAYVFRCRNEQWYTLLHCEDFGRNAKFVVCDNVLYAAVVKDLNKDQPTRCLLKLKNSSWEHITLLPSHHLIMIANMSVIYILNNDCKAIYKLDPKVKDPPIKNLISFPENTNICNAMCFNNNIIIYSSETHKGIDETAVYILDLNAPVWTRLNNLEGPAENMISFRDDNHHYILQTNGNLWKLSTSVYKLADFTFLLKMWNIQLDLRGALTYNGKLYIFIENPVYGAIAYTKFSYFSEIKVAGFHCGCSNFVPIVLPKNCLKI